MRPTDPGGAPADGPGAVGGSEEGRPLSRISQTFERLEAGRTRGLIVYLTAGDPSPQQTVDFILALERGGADVVELGVPFSDPVADGPVIQRASERALRAGMTVAKALDVLRRVREQSLIPLVVFSYLNPVLRYGWEEFTEDAAAAGADGVLLTDLSVEEADPYLEPMRRRSLDPIFLASPTTPRERLRKLSQSSRGFVYLVSRAGVTGERRSISESALPLIERARSVTALPLALGFGLSKREHMEALAPHVDAVVVGSAIVRMIGDHARHDDLPARLTAFCAELKAGLALKTPA